MILSSIAVYISLAFLFAFGWMIANSNPTERVVWFLAFTMIPPLGWLIVESLKLTVIMLAR